MRRSSRTMALRGATLAFALCLPLSSCEREEGSAAELEAAVQRSIALMNEADWETAYREVLTDAQRSVCSLEEYAESEGAGVAALTATIGAGELEVIELEAEVVGAVGLVTGTIVHTAQLSERVKTDSAFTGAGLVARRNLGTATAENPDYWIFEDGAWRWVQRRPDSPCFNEADLQAIDAVRRRIEAERED